MKILAVIPARGGSKRLPGKNIKLLNGRPVIEWSITAALGVKSITKTIVSTDSVEIAEIAKKAGADVPFLRPEVLASDDARSIDVVKHVLDFLKNNDENYDYVILLQPTSPFRNSKHINEAIELLKKLEADAITSVCECDHPPIWSNQIPKDLSMGSFIKDEFKNVRSQDLPKYYRINGAIYLTKVTRLYEENSFLFSSNSFAYEMSGECSVDIDSKLDFIIAESLLKCGELNE